MSVPENIILVENQLKVLAHLYFAQRKHVQALQLMNKKLKENLGEKGLEEVFELVVESMKANDDYRKFVLDYAEHIAVNHPVYVGYLSRLSGAGKYSAFMLGLIPARRFETISKLWKYTGHAPPEVYGGQKKYHVMAKTLVHQVVENMMRNKSYYYQLYKSFREEIDKRHPDLPAKHRHMRALRKVKKLFLSHYWTMYRKILGLPIRMPYSVERGIEQTFIKPFVDKPKLEFIDI